MWITLIVAGALHGLVLLPVLLSIAGGPGYSMSDDDAYVSRVNERSEYEYRSVKLHL